MEDMNNKPEGSGETGTPSGNPGNNNSTPGSEAVQTPKNGPPTHVPYNRFKEVNDELARLKGTGATPEKSPSVSGEPEDRLLEVISKVPDRLKGETAAIAKYAKDHNMPVEDVVTFWDAKNRVSPEDAARAAAVDETARNSQMGGTANPAVRQENKPLSEVPTNELRSMLDQRVKAGEKI